MGIQKAALSKLAKDAMNQTRLLVNNPRPLDEAAALQIYEAAW
jgi:alcohol dehydrogenase class IV